MTLEDTLFIRAPVKDVWRVTMDLERWPEWAPAVRSIRRLDAGAFGLGSRVQIQQPGQPLAVWTVTDFAEGERFSWETAWRGLWMRATHHLAPEPGGTRNTLRLNASGWTVALSSSVLRFLLRRALIAENGGLKARCEARSLGT